MLNSILINIDITNINIIKENNNYKTIIYVDPSFILKLKNYEIAILSSLNKTINKQSVLSCQKLLSNNVIIYNKGNPLGIPNEYPLKNVGREAETYLHYIIDNY